MATTDIDFSIQENKPQNTNLKSKMKKWMRNIIIIAIVIAAGFFYFKFFFVFADGVKAGQLNYVVYKGYIFKTYEGKLIQAGYKSGKSGPIQSNEFEFSVADEKVAEKLMLAGGKDVELHYKQYLGIIPWRGYSKYVVDSIIAINKPESGFPAE